MRNEQSLTGFLFAIVVALAMLSVSLYQALITKQDENKMQALRIIQLETELELKSVCKR